MRNCCPTLFERHPRQDKYNQSSGSSTIYYGSMRGNINMNTCSLAREGRAQKASEVRKKMVKFSNQKSSVHRCTFVMQPRQHQSRAAQMAQHTKCARKGKRKRREREKEKNAGSNRKKKKKSAYIFPPRPLRHDLSTL